MAKYLGTVDREAVNETYRPATSSGIVNYVGPTDERLGSASHGPPTTQYGGGGGQTAQGRGTGPLSGNGGTGFRKTRGAGGAFSEEDPDFLNGGGPSSVIGDFSSDLGGAGPGDVYGRNGFSPNQQRQRRGSGAAYYGAPTSSFAPGTPFGGPRDRNRPHEIQAELDPRAGIHPERSGAVEDDRMQNGGYSTPYWPGNFLPGQAPQAPQTQTPYFQQPFFHQWGVGGSGTEQPAKEASTPKEDREATRELGLLGKAPKQPKGDFPTPPTAPPAGPADPTPPGPTPPIGTGIPDPEGAGGGGGGPRIRAQDAMPNPEEGGGTGTGGPRSLSFDVYPNPDESSGSGAGGGPRARDMFPSPEDGGGSPRSRSRSAGAVRR
jgi:hypothetical protein